MTTWFCPECFAEVEELAERCPRCGASTDIARCTYEEKLLRASDHHLSDRRLLAAQILGRLGSRTAMLRLGELAADPTDPYLAAEAAHSLALIEPNHPIVRRLGCSGSAPDPSATRGRSQVTRILGIGEAQVS